LAPVSVLDFFKDICFKILVDISNTENEVLHHMDGSLEIAGLPPLGVRLSKRSTGLKKRKPKSL